MKKTRKTLLPCVLTAALLCSCQGQVSETPTPTGTPEASGTYTAGVYPITVAGRNGDMTVEVTFSADKIESVQVTEHTETAGVTDGAIADIPVAIVENQSLAIEAVSGATITSEAILAAVKEAVVQAGGDVDALNVAVEKNNEANIESLSADIVVVGAGAAGTTAAYRLGQNGYDVLLLEKMSFPGGATITAGGGMAITATQELIELGEHDDPAVLEGYLAENGHNLQTPELAHIYAWQGGKAVDYLRENGVEINYSNTGRTSPYYGRHAMGGGGSGFIATMSELIDEQENVTLMLSTEAKELTTDSTGAVTGLTALGSNGTTYEISAKAVILATGTYSGNAELIEENYLPNTINTAPVYLTGDGVTMATAIGAATNHLEWVEVSPSGVETSEHNGTSASGLSNVITGSASIIVNSKGERVMNEEASSAEQIKVYEADENHAMYLVMDEVGFELLKTVGGKASWGNHVNFTAETVESWLEADSIYPVMVTGSTAEEVAAAAGIDGAGLLATISSYNEMAENGTDTVFGRTMNGALEGQLYILEMHLGHTKTLGGLKANENLQILNESGEPIIGLYGAGELVSGSQGDTETGMLTWAVTSGYYLTDVIGDTLK